MPDSETNKRRSHAHQGVGPQAGRMLPELPLHADGDAHRKRGADVQDKCGKLHECHDYSR